MAVGSMTHVSVPFLSLINRTRLWFVRSKAIGGMADVSAPSLAFIARIFFWFIRLTIVEVMTHTDPFGIRLIYDLWLHFHTLPMPLYPVFHWSDGSLYDSFDQRQLEAWIMSPPSRCRCRCRFVVDRGYPFRIRLTNGSWSRDSCLRLSCVWSNRSFGNSFGQCLMLASSSLQFFSVIDVTDPLEFVHTMVLGIKISASVFPLS